MLIPMTDSHKEERRWELIKRNEHFWKLQQKSDSKLDWNPDEGDIE